MSYTWHEPDPAPDEFSTAEMEHAYAEEADRRVKEERLERMESTWRVGLEVCPVCGWPYPRGRRCAFADREDHRTEEAMLKVEELQSVHELLEVLSRTRAQVEEMAEYAEQRKLRSHTDRGWDGRVGHFRKALVRLSEAEREIMAAVS